MHLCSHKNKNSARLEAGARLVKSGHSNGPAISHQNLHLSSDDDDDGDDDNDFSQEFAPVPTQLLTPMPGKLLTLSEEFFFFLGLA